MVIFVPQCLIRYTKYQILNTFIMGGYKILKPDLIDISKIKKKRILVFGAHSDDAEFLAAGTLIQLGSAKQNNSLKVVVATDGNMGTHDHDQDRSELVSMRMTEAKIAAKKFEAKEIKFWGYADLDLQNRKKQLLKRVVKVLFNEQPDLVFSFDPWGRYDAYVHPDHRALAWAVNVGVMMATLPKWVKKNGLGDRFLSPKSQVWLFAPAEANVVVDVESVWQERLQTVEGFVSQFDREVQWKKVERMLTRTAERVGEMVGLKYAEGFRILEYDGEWDKDS